MSNFTTPLTRLTYVYISIIMTFAYSRKPLEKMLEDHFLGELEYLRKALIDIPALQAEKACIELALFLRMVDDDEKEVVLITTVSLL